MISMLRILPVLTGLLLSTQAHGNGATASFPAGGVEFKSSTNIGIAREDLYLSPGEVRVDYVFHSIAERPSFEVIGFPLPRVSAAFDSPDSVQDLGTAAGDMRNYLDFGVAVNGRPISPCCMSLPGSVTSRFLPKSWQPACLSCRDMTSGRQRWSNSIPKC